MAEKKDPHMTALQEVYAALKDLDVDARRKVLSSAFALLGIDLGPPKSEPVVTPTGTPSEAMPPTTRPLSLVELLQQKQPVSNAQRIALFAYYRERYENQPRFAREDLKPYFAKARETPAANYVRDFVEAVRKGWIHEDGADSYLTSKGLEAVESGFEIGQKSPVRRNQTRRQPSRGTAKTRSRSRKA